MLAGIRQWLRDVTRTATLNFSDLGTFSDPRETITAPLAVEGTKRPTASAKKPRASRKTPGHRVSRRKH